MPIYEYRCTSCSHQMEALQKMNDAPLTECPQCSKPTLEKKISAAAFRLKGSGWYETDFKDKKPAKKENNGKGESACSSGTCSSTADA